MLGCSKAPIVYEIDEKIELALVRGMEKVDILATEADAKYVVYFYEDGNKNVALINKINRSFLDDLIENSNRYLQLGDRRIPVLFVFDRYATSIKGMTKSVLTGGYSVIYNYKHEIDYEGMNY